LVVTNRYSTGFSESKKFYRAINQAHRSNFKDLVNTPFIEVESKDGLILEDPSAELALGVQYFLQGIGLLSAMPLRMSLSRQESVLSQNSESSSLPVEPEQEAVKTE